jgi:hypothetical protein
MPSRCGRGSWVKKMNLVLQELHQTLLQLTVWRMQPSADGAVPFPLGGLAQVDQHHVRLPDQIHRLAGRERPGAAPRLASRVVVENQHDMECVAAV